MKIGYPCLNWGLRCSPSKTFRLASYTEDRFNETVDHNLTCLQKVLDYNLENKFFFFRISSDTIPFASHPICKVNWQKVFSGQLKKIGNFIRKNNFRISMHPDQFTLLNSLKSDVVDRSIAELKYHSDFLDAMGLDSAAKIQIHVGGVFGDKSKAKDRFVNVYNGLISTIKERLVIENDDRLFHLKDCFDIYELTGIPILFDNFHHECLNNGETMRSALGLAQKTWKKKDGVLMVDFSHQEPGGRRGKHAQSINGAKFAKFINQADGINMDIMLEIKDKEKSAQKAIKLLKKNKNSLVSIKEQ